MMIACRWRDLFESIGLVAIVVSLVFVGFQVRQDRVIARSELGSGTFEFEAMIGQTMSSTDVSTAWAKMLDRPEDLAADEMIRVNGILSMAKHMFMRECYLTYIGVYKECDGLLTDQAGNYFGSKYAQSWWRMNKPENTFGMLDPLDEKIRSLDVNLIRSKLEDIQPGL